MRDAAVELPESGDFKPAEAIYWRSKSNDQAKFHRKVSALYFCAWLGVDCDDADDADDAGILIVCAVARGLASNGMTQQSECSVLLRLAWCRLQ
jgi:hypothetical protein